jgi:predicted NBD/HSP70 family sugar kinase
MSSENAGKYKKRPIRTATPSSVRAVNRSIMLNLIRQNQPISRAELARFTGVFRSSVSDIVDELIEQNFVSEQRSTPSQRGRVPISLQLNDCNFPVLGLNIRPEYCQLAWAGLNGQIHDSLTFATPTSPGKLVQALGREMQKLARPAQLKGRRAFQRIGVAVPGHVDAFSGRILWTPTHAEMNDFPIAETIQAHTGIETLADNDCNVGALSESWLSSQRHLGAKTNFVFLNVSDFGTGAGAVMNGEIYLGHDSRLAAEVGHMVVEPLGPVCRCGRRGCWELYVSNDATWRRLHPRLPFSVEKFQQLFTRARQGEPAVLAAFRQTARYLSLGISNIGYIFNPAEVIVAGRITAIWDLIEEDIRSSFASSQLRYSIHPARLSADDSLLHGAVCLALRDTFAPPRFGDLGNSGRQSA